jgi:hypothetical protein
MKKFDYSKTIMFFFSSSFIKKGQLSGFDTSNLDSSCIIFFVTFYSSCKQFIIGILTFFEIKTLDLYSKIY